MSYRFGFVVAALLLWCCKTYNKNTPVFFLLENKADIRSGSSCRNSGLLPLSNEVELKNTLLQCSKESAAKCKLKTSDTPEKVNYRITQTTLTISEKCGDKTIGTQPQISLREQLTLENTATKELLQFNADTIVPTSSSLAQPAAAAPEKPDLKPYINGLTNKNFVQVKKHFGIK